MIIITSQKVGTVMTVPTRQFPGIYASDLCDSIDLNIMFLFDRAKTK